MTAKRKLNAAHFLGCLFVAGLIGLVTDSLAIFVVVGLATVATAYHAGDIRR